MTAALPSDGPELAPAALHLAGPSAPATAVVVSNERCTASRKAAGFVRHVALDVSRTPLAGRFIAGQSFGVIPPGLDTHGKPHKLRLYSIASPSRGEDGEGRVLATTVKRTIEEHHETGRLLLGVCSNYLCDLRPGDEVKVTGPNGKRFVLPARPEEHDYVFFATGTGIAPFRAFVHELGAKAPRSRVALVMGSPYASDLLYDGEFRSRVGERFAYLPTLSRERQGDGSPACYVHDRLLGSGREVLGPLLEGDRTLVYVCGVAGMELGVLRNLAKVLSPASRSRYLGGDGSAMANPDAWDRRSLTTVAKPTRRVFLEVY